MIKEIRISMPEFCMNALLGTDLTIMEILKEKGFPVDDSILYNWKPKAGLKYYEFHDHATDEIVVQWEE